MYAHTGKLAQINLSPSTPPGDVDYYARLYPTSRVCVAESMSEASDVEVEGSEKTITPVTSLDTTGI